MAIGAPTLGPKPPEVTTPIGAPSDRHDLRPLPRGRAAVRTQADAQALRPVRQRAPNALGAGKAALDPAPLLDRPGERRLDRIDRLVEFVAIKAKAGFESERIARAKPDRSDVGLRQQQARERLGLRRGKRDLVSVLAGVAGSGDEGLEPARSAPAGRS